MTTADFETLLDIKQSSAALGVSVATFQRRVADGTFPKPIKIGHLTRWPKAELIQAIESIKASRL